MKIFDSKSDRKQSTATGSPSAAQLSQYEVSKTIPLKGYRKEAKDTKDYWTKSIDALRNLYPGTTDEDRGVKFQSLKENIAEKMQVENVDGQVLMDDVDKVKKSIPHASKSIAGMSEKPGEEQQKVQTAEIEKRSEKRVKAMLEEYDRLHLTQDQFEQDIEPDKISEETLRDITASY